jgi:hypothetical protein
MNSSLALGAAAATWAAAAAAFTGSEEICNRQQWIMKGNEK